MLQRRDISNRWRMFEACKPGDYRCSECAEQVIDPDGKVATCACECHNWIDDDYYGNLEDRSNPERAFHDNEDNWWEEI